MIPVYMIWEAEGKGGERKNKEGKRKGGRGEERKKEGRSQVYTQYNFFDKYTYARIEAALLSNSLCVSMFL